MPTRVPLDVDLEDRLIYGLSPQRFGYAAVGLLAAMAVWHSVPGVAGPAVAVGIGLCGAALAWGRLGGRGFDAWLLAIASYVPRNYELIVDRQALSALRRRRLKLARPPRRPPSEWTPRPLRTSPQAPRLKVLGSWEAEP